MAATSSFKEANHWTKEPLKEPCCRKSNDSWISNYMVKGANILQRDRKNQRSGHIKDTINVKSDPLGNLAKPKDQAD
jgi:hypothetical protein